MVIANKDEASKPESTITAYKLKASNLTALVESQIKNLIFKSIFKKKY